MFCISQVLSDNQSSPSTRPSSSTSSEMLRTNLQSRSDTFSKRRSSNLDINDLPLSRNQQIVETTPPKTIIINGKCSKVFKTALEQCVEDCILEFPSEKHSIYVPKTGLGVSLAPGSNRNSVLSMREQSANARQSGRSNRRLNSLTPYNNTLPQINSVRKSLPNSTVLPSAALAATAAARLRQQLTQTKFALEEDISEEPNDQQLSNEQKLLKNINEIEQQSEQVPIVSDEPIGSAFNRDLTVLSLPTFLYDRKTTTKAYSSHRDRQKDYRLSDLVMLGPEYFRDVFSLPRPRSQKQHRTSKTVPLTELELIKKDLFHRYLWTQKPQVSCRIRPLSTYTRDTTFVI